MSEKTILAYFHSAEEAQEAMAKLQALRIEEMRVDRFGRFPGSGNTQLENPLHGDFAGLGFLTLGGNFDGPDAGILAAADVSASGMSTGGEDDTMGRNYILTAVMGEHVHHQALRVVEHCGGLV